MDDVAPLRWTWRGVAWIALLVAWSGFWIVFAIVRLSRGPVFSAQTVFDLLGLSAGLAGAYVSSGWVSLPRSNVGAAARADVLAAAVVAVAALLAVLPGCSDDDVEQRPAGVIDEVAGSYGGVRMGASEEDVRRVFGEPGEGEGFFPLGESFGEIGGAPAVRNWPPDDRAAPTVLRYDDVAFLVGSRGVFAFVVTADGARTRREVAIGDPLADARRAYDVGCGEGVAGEALVGETPTYPYCRGTIGERHRIWFGEDPIRSITLARVGTD